MNQIVDNITIAVGSREGVNSKLSCGWLGIKEFLVKTVGVRFYIWKASSVRQVTNVLEVNMGQMVPQAAQLRHLVN